MQAIASAYAHDMNLSPEWYNEGKTFLPPVSAPFPTMMKQISQHRPVLNHDVDKVIVTNCCLSYHLLPPLFEVLARRTGRRADVSWARSNVCKEGQRPWLNR